MDKRDKWYPKEVYNKREDITRMNKARYDLQEDQAWDTINRIEKDLQRELSMRERLTIMDIYHGKD
jgi:hypothetical protein